MLSALEMPKVFNRCSFQILLQSSLSISAETFERQDPDAPTIKAASTQARVPTCVTIHIHITWQNKFL